MERSQLFWEKYLYLRDIDAILGETAVKSAGRRLYSELISSVVINWIPSQSIQRRNERARKGKEKKELKRSNQKTEEEEAEKDVVECLRRWSSYVRHWGQSPHICGHYRPWRQRLGPKRYFPSGLLSLSLSLFGNLKSDYWFDCLLEIHGWIFLDF